MKKSEMVKKISEILKKTDTSDILVDGYDSISNLIILEIESAGMMPPTWTVPRFYEGLTRFMNQTWEPEND